MACVGEKFVLSRDTYLQLMLDAGLRPHIRKQRLPYGTLEIEKI